MTAPVRNRRRPTARRRHRRLRDVEFYGALLALALLGAAVYWLAHHPLAVVLLAAVAVAATAAVVDRKYRKRTARHLRGRTVTQYQQLNPTQFEHALADLCRRDGCTRITVVGGAGDLAADVLATTPDGRRILIQAKRYAPGNPVRSPAMQAVNGTYRQIHGADLAAVVTTSGFTADAAAFGQRVGLRMLDAQALAGWASRTGPAPWH